MIFASTLFTRAVDPVVPKIAPDLGIDVKTAALLSTAFTFPYALTQPVLGTIGDFFGKTRLMNVSLAIVVTTTLICAFASNFPLLVAMRVIAGMLAGGIFPVGVAIVGDLVPVHERQVAIGRLLAVGLTGNLIGAMVSGVIGDLLGWRGVFFSIGAFGLVVAVIAFFAFRGLRPAEPNRSISPRRRPDFAAFSPIHGPKSASARCSSKASSSTACFPMWRSCCWRPDRRSPLTPVW